MSVVILYVTGGSTLTLVTVSGRTVLLENQINALRVMPNETVFDLIPLALGMTRCLRKMKGLKGPSACNAFMRLINYAVMALLS